ncbi:hypothetical protein ANCCAN_26292 [Ancylostoma caninum]|uniref:Uncharacterized protein n=1 Tax=Ancylostoma caninum TaxID=29170 RepID=A0A368FAP1_ANCCA|nr:hypothetical protein ANCCAN_26292 [Ancylostoma caninum]
MPVFFSFRMRSSILILAFAAGVSLASYDPVFVDELEDIVTSRQDERELDRLDDDKYMIRSEKKEKLDVILARQSELVQRQRLYIQKLFAVEVERKKLRYQIKMEHRLSRVTDPELVEYWKQVEEIDNDMTISNKGADMKKKELKYKLPPMLRRLVRKL